MRRLPFGSTLVTSFLLVALVPTLFALVPFVFEVQSQVNSEFSSTLRLEKQVREERFRAFCGRTEGEVALLSEYLEQQIEQWEKDPKGRWRMIPEDPLQRLLRGNAFVEWAQLYVENGTPVRTWQGQVTFGIDPLSPELKDLIESVRTTNSQRYDWKAKLGPGVFLMGVPIFEPEANQITKLSGILLMGARISKIMEALTEDLPPETQVFYGELPPPDVTPERYFLSYGMLAQRNLQTPFGLYLPRSVTLTKSRYVTYPTVVYAIGLLGVSCSVAWFLGRILQRPIASLLHMVEGYQAAQFQFPRSESYFQEINAVMHVCQDLATRLHTEMHERERMIQEGLASEASRLIHDENESQKALLVQFGRLPERMTTPIQVVRSVVDTLNREMNILQQGQFPPEFESQVARLLITWQRVRPALESASRGFEKMTRDMEELNEKARNIELSSQVRASSGNLLSPGSGDPSEY